MRQQRIAVVGAGPVGLTAALALAQAGHAVEVFEKRGGLSNLPRAPTLHAPTLDMLAALGVLDRVLPFGRRIDAIDYYLAEVGPPERVARFQFSMLAGVTAHPWRLHLEQHLLTPELADALVTRHDVQVRFGMEVVGVTGDDYGVALRLNSGTRTLTREFDWLVGADGAYSVVREAAGIDFTGEDYEKRMLRLIARDDLRRLIPDMAGVSYVYREGESISLLEMAGAWRVILRLTPDIDDATALAPGFAEAAMRRMLLSCTSLDVRLRDIYSARRRVAATFRRGRILLAGDAAHLTNTRGGMNLNCGMHDAWALAQAFRRGVDAGSLASAVATWAAVRRSVVADTLVPRTDRVVEGGLTYLASVEASARHPDLALAFLRDAAMIDVAPPIEMGTA